MGAFAYMSRRRLVVGRMSCTLRDRAADVKETSATRPGRADDQLMGGGGGAVSVRVTDLVVSALPVGPYTVSV